MPAPANDDFANAILVAGATGSNASVTDNSEATTEVDEPTGSVLTNGIHLTVWFKWVAPSDGIATFDTLGSSGDTTLAIWTGTALVNLVEKASNDDSVGVASVCEFEFLDGVTYYIQLGAFSDGDTGSYVLNWVAQTLIPVAGKFVWVGDDSSSDARTQVSSDGETWVPVVNDIDGNILAAAVGGGRYLVGGSSPDGVIAESADAVIWLTDTTPLDNEQVSSLFYAGDRFVAVMLFTSPSSIMTGELTGVLHEWTVRASPFDGGGTGSGCYAPALGRIVIVGIGPTGDDRVLTSDDGGLTWTAHGDPFTGQTGFTGFFPRAVCWSEERALFVCVGLPGGFPDAIFTSPDGIVWTGQGDPLSATTQCVTWSTTRGKFVAGGEVSVGVQIATSDDGIAWSTFTCPLGTVNGIVAGVGGLLVATGEENGIGTGPPGTLVATSLDGETWTAGTTPLDGIGGLGFAIAAVEETPPPPVPPVVMPSTPRFVITNRDTETLTFLDKLATDRTVTFVLDDTTVISGSVPSDSPEINIPADDDDPFLSFNTRLLYAFDKFASGNYECFASGIIMQVEDQAADAPSSRFVAMDSWQYLMSRPVLNADGILPGQNGLSYTATKANEIALQLLAQTVLINGPVGIDETGGTIVDCDEIDIVFQQGLSVGQAWKQLCATGVIDIELQAIYDPVTRPGILAVLNMAPQIGSVKHNAIFAWDKPSRSLTALSRLLDGTAMANAVQFFAGQGGAAVAPQTDALSIAKNGEWWMQQHFPGKETSTAEVILLALTQLLLLKNGNRTLTFDPAPERSPRPVADYKPGDIVPVYASRRFRDPLAPDLVESSYQRVRTLPMAISDSGTVSASAVTTTEGADGS